MSAESGLRYDLIGRAATDRSGASTPRPGGLFAAAAWTLLLLVPIALLLLDQATTGRARLEQQAESLARASMQTLDGEFAAAEPLLTGLAAWAELAGGDASRFYARAIEVPKPPGSWIVLFGRDGSQKFSTLHPYGTPLPPASAAMEDSLREIAERRRGESIDPSPAALPDEGRVGIGIPILRNGDLSSVVALMTTTESLMRRFDAIELPAGWCGVIRDRADRVILRWPATRAGETGNDDGGCGEHMAPFLAKSTTTGWSAAVNLPVSELETPMQRAFALAGGGLFLVALMGFAFFVQTRVDRPSRARAAADAADDERFRFMADTVPSILFVTDADGRCEYVNQRFYEYTGMAPGSAQGLGWLDPMHPEDQRRVVDSLMRPAPATDLRLNEVRLRGRDGSYRWFLGRSRPVRDVNGNVVKWFGSSTDIDDIKKSGAALRHINERLSAVLSSIDECYYTVDRDWRITYINPNAASFFGKAPDDLVGRSIYAVAPELRDTDIEADFARALRERVPIHLIRPSLLKPGRWVAVNCYPWTEGLSVFFRDVTRQKGAEIALRRTQELLQQTMDALSAQIAILDEKGTILAANAAWRQFADGTACGVGRNYLAACPALVPDAAQAQQMLAVLNAVLQEKQREGLVYYARPVETNPRWFQMRATRFDSGQGLRVVVAHEDITEIKEAEAGLRDLASRLLRVQDDERRRMARELHDTTAQNLAAAILELDRLRQSLPASNKASDKAWDDLRALIESALQEIRTLSYLLHPPLLDELGLASALRWYVRGFENRSGIAVGLTIREGFGRLPAAAESALFRIVQEALTNIHRHSGSATAQIHLARSADRVVLEIRDRGHGMPDQGSADPALLGVGVSGMRARLHQLGGDLSIQSTDQGTTVTATLSLERVLSISAADEIASRAVAE